MRRFFSRNKDNKEQPQQQANLARQSNSKDSTVPIRSQPDAKTDALPEDAAVAPHRRAGAGQQLQAPVTPSKQVAFAVKTLPATPDNAKQDEDNEDVHSYASYHGGPSGSAGRQGARPTAAAGLSCFPVASTSRSASNPAISNGHLLSMPSQPIRHASIDVSSLARDKDRDATLRASQTPTSPMRGEIPRFGGAATPTTPQHQQQQQRSTTSLSQNTSASTSSSMLDARQAFYGSNNSSSNGDKAYYPNLAILATYSRDMSSLNGHNGQSSIMQHLTWSEITDEQLVENLGGRERTRQEVLFEMVCSEERYVQELIALKENYLQPLLERHSLTNARFPTTQDGLSSSTMRSINAPAPSIDAPNYYMATMKSTTSIDSRRPYLSLSAGSTSAGIRYASNVTSDHGHGHAPSRASHHRGSEAHPVASAEHLPIAARFARRVSIDSPPMQEVGSVGHGADKGSTNTTRTAVEDEHGVLKHGRRDISGGSGTTAVDSGEETDPSLISRHAHFNDSRKSTQKSRLHPLFANLSTSTRHTDKENKHANNVSSTSVDAPKTFRHHLKNLVPPVPNKLHKISSPDLKNRIGENGLAGPGWVVKELPSDLKIVSEVVADQIMLGHQALSERLRARYEEQFPLVRTLADVFHDQAWMIEHYATYVLHLERALADIEETLSLMNPLLASNKKVKSKDKEMVKEQKTLAKIIMHLEEQAALKGAPGLSICLSQPFQRLLKYPLLFQSLLYHTDPSTRDYDATQKLGFEIDGIVRSIESEKASEEDRSKTRDIWARIEGINDRALLSPRADRLLVSEAAMWSSSLSGDSAVAAGRRTFSDASRRVDDVQLQAATSSKKKAVRRLSDMTGIGGHQGEGSDRKKKQPSVGSKRDVWLVTFTDVIIRCQRVGVTNLPMQSSLGGMGHSCVLNKESHRRTVLLSTRERNLYRFQKVDRWIMEDKTSLGAGGIVNMDAMARSRRQSERIAESSEADAEESFDMKDHNQDGEIQAVKFERAGDASALDGAESRMSFAYSSNEPRPTVFDIDPLIGLKIEGIPAPSRPEAKTAPRVPLTISAATHQAAKKRGLAAAKFSNRLRPSTAESSNLLGKRAITPSQSQHPPRSASATYDRERGGFSKPTAASLAKASPSTSAFLTAGNKLPRPDINSRSATPEAKRVRAASSSASPRSTRPSNSAAPMPSSPQSPSKGTVRSRVNSLPSSKGGSGARQLRTKHSSEKLARHGKLGSDTDSGVALYNQYWKDEHRA